ncbi:MAG: ComEC/Rec2 family competence protein [Buchananella hordeovulneris]|nr:ComEC/Rec2 family competence protein [Buchananella hordeovulneris]
MRPRADYRLLLGTAGAWLASLATWQAPALWGVWCGAAAGGAVIAGVALARRERGRHALAGPRLAGAVLLGCVCALVAGVHAHLLVAAKQADPLVAAAAAGRVVHLEVRVCSWPVAGQSGWRLLACVERARVPRGAGSAEAGGGSSVAGGVGAARPVSPSGAGLAAPGGWAEGTAWMERGWTEGRWGERGGRVELRGPQFLAELTLGQRLRVSGLARPARLAQRQLARVQVAVAPELLPASPADSWRREATRAVRGAATSPLVAGMGWGQRTDMPTRLVEQMRATSLTHLTAVSGTHLAVVLGAVALLAGGPRWLRLALTGATAAAFVWLVGPTASVLRSATMAGIGLGSLALNRSVSTTGSLWLTATAMLLADPHNAADFSFALSLSATAGIVLWAPRVARPLSRFLPRWLALLAAVPVVASASTLPVAVLLNPTVPLYAVPANLLASPAVALVTVGTLLSLAASPWQAGVIFTWVADAAAAWIEHVAAFFAGLPGAGLPWPQGWGGAALAAGLLASLVAGVWAAQTRRGRALRVRLRRRAKRVAENLDGWASRAGRGAKLGAVGWGVLAVALLLAVGLGAWWIWQRYQRMGQWEVYQCDVGQGSALLVRTQGSGAVLFDTGPQDGHVERCLREAGVERIDLLVLSHLHADHIDGVPAVLARVPVAQVLLGPGVYPAHTYRWLVGQFEAAALPYRVPSLGEEGQLPGGVRWRVYGPSVQLGEASANNEEGMNNTSLVVGVDRAGLDVLVPGDAEQALQAELVEQVGRLSPPDGVWDVAVVPHHGSANWDPALPGALRSPVAIISVGADNSYGHPVGKVSDGYARWGRVYRTDQCGPIALAARRDAEGEVAGLLVQARCRGG